jgi:hypothetical protein
MEIDMTHALLNDWIELSRSNGIVNICTSDFHTAKKLHLTHLRGGKIPTTVSREADGAAVLAYGYDELSNVCALLPNGESRQFIDRR